MNFSKLKATASRVFARKDAYINAARPYAKRAASYAKENPSDVMLGIMTLLLMDIESDVDDLEDHTGISAAVDLHDYHSR